MIEINPAARDARLDFRLTSENKRLIEQAATLTGQSLSDFAVANLVRVAQETVQQASITRMSLRDRDAFLKIIESQTEPNEALKAAAQRYKRRRD